jgi:hypothetical protein
MERTQQANNQRVVVSAVVFLLCSTYGYPAQSSCVISGRVIDEGGRPIGTAVVSALSKRFGAPSIVDNSALPDSTGAYCIRDLVKGRLVVTLP